MKAAAPINEMCGTEVCGVSVEADGFCREGVAALADDVRDGNDRSMICGWKVILPNAQSINGL